MEASHGALWAAVDRSMGLTFADPEIRRTVLDIIDAHLQQRKLAYAAHTRTHSLVLSVAEAGALAKELGGEPTVPAAARAVCSKRLTATIDGLIVAIGRSETPQQKLLFHTRLRHV